VEVRVVRLELMYIGVPELLVDKIKFDAFLLNVYGVGKSRREVIFKNFGIRGTVRMKVINCVFYKKVVLFLDDMYVTEKALVRVVKGVVWNEWLLQSYRGWRMKHGLPACGQRSRTNGGTARRLGIEFHCFTKKERKINKIREALSGTKDTRKNLRRFFKRMRKKQYRNKKNKSKRKYWFR
jgi:ribosomal protein S13